MILKSLLEVKILKSDELRVLIDEIEMKDRVVIKDRDDILTEMAIIRYKRKRKKT
ncbi:MAG: hypothetical protein QMD22_06125 [archaeon]|nr:hypothetical protein [archaeon]